ncbi:MAG: hypothetical protein ACTSSC_07350, partial [Promethearchaeota archaeon]
ANGGYNTKQSIGIYGTKPPTMEWDIQDVSKIQKSILKKSLPDIVEKVNGKLTVEGYSIIYDRAGQPKRGVLVGSLENGDRTLAIITSESEMLLTLENQDLVGKNFLIKYDSIIDRNIVISME